VDVIYDHLRSVHGGVYGDDGIEGDQAARERALRRATDRRRRMVDPRKRKQLEWEPQGGRCVIM